MVVQAMTNQAPTVSVVLSVRNGGSDLPQALDTILEQSFADFELIVINNGSTDRTLARFSTRSAIPGCGSIIRKTWVLAAALNLLAVFLWHEGAISQGKTTMTLPIRPG